VEYFIKDAFEKLGLSEYKEFIHFGLTSQDINNTAIPLSTRSFRESVHAFFDYFDIKIEDLSIGRTFNACTHGQPATSFGERNWCFCRTFRGTNAFVV
jgi:adenylosuccinate lyase